MANNNIADAIFSGKILNTVAQNDGVKVTVDAFDRGLEILDEIDPNLVNRIADSLSSDKDKKDTNKEEK